MVNIRRYSDLPTHLSENYALGDTEAWYYTLRLQATADGRYAFCPMLNQLVDASSMVDVRPVDFLTWLAGAWASGSATS